jgi:hypothetical protein
MDLFYHKSKDPEMSKISNSEQYVSSKVYLAGDIVKIGNPE